MKKTFKITMVAIILTVNLFCACNVSADDSIEDTPIVNIFNSQDTFKDDQPPVISAGAAIIMDTKSGRILYEKNAFTRRSIASTTKIMTAIVAIENGKDDEDVVVSKRAARISGSTVNLKEGKTYKLGDLLYAMLLRSGNDAAIAIAEHVGGSVEAFAEMMNRKAAEIGANNTNFVTPHGLDNPQHFSTAYDLALITQYALKNPKFCSIVSCKTSTFNGNPINNTNEMLSLYPGADGVKTGYTGQAGRCLVTSVTKDGSRYISVVLNCASRTQRAQASKKILDYAFFYYKNHEYLKSGEKISEIKVHKGLKGNTELYAEQDVALPLKSDEIERVKTVYQIPKTIEAPVTSDMKVGTVQYELDGKVLAKTNILIKDSIGRKDFYYYFDQIFRKWAGLVHSS